ncbi:MAG: serine hydrolase [Luteitalea sp.]|nr:serine hydrolase [Luteitalea sp.]
MSHRYWTTILAATLLVGHAAAAEEPVANQDLLRAQLERRIEQRLAAVDGVIGVWIKDLVSGAEIAVNEDRVFPTASSIKIAILVELYRQAEHGRLRLEDRHRVADSDRAGGSGVLQHLGAAELSLRDLATLMIVLSDNTATNILIDKVGMDTVNATLDRLGLPATRLRRKMIRPDEQAAGRENVSTPAELGRLVERIYREKVVTPQACREMLQVLAHPKSGPLRSRLPQDVRVAHKTGGLGGVVNDVGVVLLEGRPFIVSAMSTLVGNGEEAGRTISDVARLAYDYFARLERANAYGAQLPPGLMRR